MNQSQPTRTPVSDAFLSRLVTELISPDTVAIVLVGSFAQGEATPYSDIDIAHIVSAAPAGPDLRYNYREGCLVGVATRQIGWYREVLTRPERAMFNLASLRSARVLHDRAGIFGAFQRELEQFSWASLQAGANTYASTLLMQLTEAVHKILSAVLRKNGCALFEATSSLIFGLTQAVAIQRGVLVVSSSRYMQQVREELGFDSAWVRYHRLAIDPDTDRELAMAPEARAAAALRLYQETVRLLHETLEPDDRGVVEYTGTVIDTSLHLLVTGGRSR